MSAYNGRPAKRKDGNETVSSAENPAWSRSEGILDVKDALARLGGNEEIYLKLLKRFASGIGATPLLTRSEALAEEKKACDQAHSLKGVAANLSMPRLYKLAAAYEASLKDGTPDFLLRQSAEEAREEALAFILSIE